MKHFVLAALCAILCLPASAWTPGEGLKTRWAAEVDPSCPLPEYPRPQMVRPDWQNLNGLWDYAIRPVAEEYGKPEGQILVPFCAESALSGVQRHVGSANALWYERSFTVPKAWKDRDVLLNFGAVDWKAEVWVNGVRVGEHTGGYAPFSFNITTALKKSGKQTLRIRVWDASDEGFQPRGKQIEHTHGIWYTPVTGIWQTVWLEPVSPVAHVVSYNPVWDAANSTLNVEVSAEGSYDEARIQLSYQGGLAGSGASIKVDNPKLWSPDEPEIYDLCISLVKDGKTVDRVEGYTCLRSVSVLADPKPDRNVNSYKRIGLNGERTFFFGPLDQGWWPDGLYTAPTDEALKFDILKVKEWGWNMIRKHIKVEPARWYYWCDQLGVSVWQDMPCIADHSSKTNAYRNPKIARMQSNEWQRDSFLGGTDCIVPQEWKDNYYKEWGEIIDALKVFQCISVWVPFNEAWGQFDTPEVVAFTRKKDGTRLVNEASGGNYAFAGDIIDTHHYACPAMNNFEAKFINVLGEYGGLGFPVPGHLWKEDNNWGYGKVLGSGEEVYAIYDKFADMLKVFISTGCAAAVYTQITDVEIEVNGIMTYDREVVKMDENRLRQTNLSVIKSL
ncbi:MAG: beta-galactosidase [Bacteroidales bacterium]|nr:beta-galactosidase [Bacteroidales bacterium]